MLISTSFRKQKSAAICQVLKGEGLLPFVCLEACYQDRDKGNYLPRLIHMQQNNMNKPQYFDKNYLEKSIAWDLVASSNLADTQEAHSDD